MTNIAVTQKDSIIDQLEQLHQRIARRAVRLVSRPRRLGRRVRRLAECGERPRVEACGGTAREGWRLHDRSSALGRRCQRHHGRITPQDVVIQAATEHEHTEDKGQVHRCEFTAGQVFRSLTFPKAVDATKAKADYQNGMLNITVPIAPATRAKRVDVKAA